MINSNLYDYVDILNRAADASWLRQEVISNNIAMQDTPGYKRSDVEFESVLQHELGRGKFTSLDEKVKNIHMNHLYPRVYVDSASYSYRIDGNNVDPEQEYVRLAETQIKYNAMIDSMDDEFTRIKSVLG